MDADQEQSNPLQREQAGSFSWIAALLVGGILILMLLVIFTIVIWKCIKKPNTADKNWAGPSPLAARELHENNSFDMNEFPVATNDLSFKTPSSITLMCGQPHISPKDYGLSNDVSQRGEGNIKPFQVIGVKAEISIPPPTAGEKEHTRDTTSTVQPSTEINATVLPEEPILAPPPDSVLDSSMSQWDEALARSDFEENQLPPPPLSWSVIDYHNDTRSQNTLNAQTILKCEKDTSFNTDYQLLPPPPPELL